jgi:hypothetical protein
LKHGGAPTKDQTSCCTISPPHPHSSTQHDSTVHKGDLAKRSLIDILFRGLAKRPLMEICTESALIEILYRDLARRPLLVILYRDLVKRVLARRSFLDSLNRDLTLKSLTKIFYGDLL